MSDQKTGFLALRLNYGDLVACGLPICFKQITGDLFFYFVLAISHVYPSYYIVVDQGVIENVLRVK